WSSQRQMAEHMALLAEQLKAVADQQKATVSSPPPATAAKAPEINGVVVHGSQAAAVTEVLICRTGDGEIVRRLWTGDIGEVNSGPLPVGDYSVIAKGV